MVITAGQEGLALTPKMIEMAPVTMAVPCPFSNGGPGDPVYMRACHQTVQDTGSSQSDI